MVFQLSMHVQIIAPVIAHVTAVNSEIEKRNKPTLSVFVCNDGFRFEIIEVQVHTSTNIQALVTGVPWKQQKH